MHSNTNPTNYGGLTVRRLGAAICPDRSADAPGLTIANRAYRFEILTLIPGEVVHRIGLSSAALWSVAGELHVNGSATPPAHSALVESDGLIIENNADTIAVALLAGVAEVNENASYEGVIVHAPSDLHRTARQWGEESPITADASGFAFRRVTLTAGQRTELQYAERKRTTSLLITGNARLHHAEDAGHPGGPVKTVDLEPVTAIEIPPRALHGFEATTDATLFEVSTPYANDAVVVEPASGSAAVAEHKSRARTYAA